MKKIHLLSLMKKLPVFLNLLVGFSYASCLFLGNTSISKSPHTSPSLFSLYLPIAKKKFFNTNFSFRGHPKSLFTSFFLYKVNTPKGSKISTETLSSFTNPSTVSIIPFLEFPPIIPQFRRNVPLKIYVHLQQGSKRLFHRAKWGPRTYIIVCLTPKM